MSGRSPPAALLTPLLVGAGGFAGAALRFLVGHLVPGPPGTLLVNVL